MAEAATEYDKVYNLEGLASLFKGVEPQTAHRYPLDDMPPSSLVRFFFAPPSGPELSRRFCLRGTKSQPAYSTIAVPVLFRWWHNMAVLAGLLSSLASVRELVRG